MNVANIFLILCVNRLAAAVAFGLIGACNRGMFFAAGIAWTGQQLYRCAVDRPQSPGKRPIGNLLPINQCCVLCLFSAVHCVCTRASIGCCMPGCAADEHVVSHRGIRRDGISTVINKAVGRTQPSSASSCSSTVRCSGLHSTRLKWTCASCVALTATRR